MKSAQGLIDMCKGFAEPLSENHVKIDMSVLLDLELRGKIVFYPSEGLVLNNQDAIQVIAVVPEERKLKPPKPILPNHGWTNADQLTDIYNTIKKDERYERVETRNIFGFVTKVEYKLSDTYRRYDVPIIPDASMVDQSLNEKGEKNGIQVSHKTFRQRFWNKDSHKF